MSEGIRCMWMRGGTSKGGYFLAADLPADIPARNALILSLLGTPDPRQIDGMGGGTPLTSKVAILSPSARPGIDVDYLFLQVGVEEPLVSDAQNCGNILAGVAPFAIERGLVAASGDSTLVRIYMENSGQRAEARVAYGGQARIDGVPGRASAIAFADIAGATCGALFPSGQPRERLLTHEVTLIDNGMPCVLIRAQDLGLSGGESPATLEANAPLRATLEALRLAAGPRMNLGDVAQKSVPKMTLISAPDQGGAIRTRSFIPHRCHGAIRVFGAVSTATACLTPGTMAEGLAHVTGQDTGQETGQHMRTTRVSVEHPSGEMSLILHHSGGQITRTEVLRTARKLMDGLVFPPETAQR